MSGNKEDTLRQFCDVTGADETRSRFFLESSNWQLEVALSSFYEHGGNIDEAPTNTAATPSIPTATLSDSDMESPPGSPIKTQKKDKKKAPPSKFATLDSLQQDSSSDEEEACCSKNVKNEIKLQGHPKNTSNDKNFTETTQEIVILKRKIERLLSENCELRKQIEMLKKDADKEAGQAFYAGGSERSGQQILGPGKARKDIVTEMFKSVRERGAVVFEDEPSSTSRGRGGLFSGVGYRLGQTTDDHEEVTPQNAQQQQESSRSVRLRLYREGFTVDQGALRLYSDPENAEFLFCIRRGEIPPELAAAAGGGEVRVSLEDRRHEPCPQAAAKLHAFSGKGQMLGSPTPPTVGATAPVAAAAGDRAANQRAAQDALHIDEAQPVTTIQFRLADGSRLTGRFNHSHTVEDLRQYVARAEPAYQLQAFALLTTFPSTELSDPAATVAQANLLNTTLLQRLK